MSTTLHWKNLLTDLLHSGVEVSPKSAGADWRGNTCKELVGYQSTIPMFQPVVLAPERKLGLRFLVAEAAWIASGDNRVATIAPFAKAISGMSDDGQRFFGAYGPKFIDQLSFAVETLMRDGDSRQAVVSIWREQPRKTKDTPCTLSLQFLIRGGRLHCVASMRSSDAWTGWVYDVFNFSMLAAVVALELRQQAKHKLEWDNFVMEDPTSNLAHRRLHLLSELQLGYLTLTAGSQHLYERDREDAVNVLSNLEQPNDVLPLNLDEFVSSQQLIDHLWDLAWGRENGKTFLRELFQ